MRREVEVYGDRVQPPPPGGGRWTSGSGYLLAARLVLTAAHVVCPAGPPLADIRVRGGSGELVRARVVWHRRDGGIDVALVEITDPAWSDPKWRHPARWGRLVTSRPSQTAEAVGFPKVVASLQARDSHHAVGVLNPSALVKSNLCALEVGNPPSPAGGEGSQWAGMSGAALRCPGRADLVIGVVTQDPAGFDSRRLVATPITAVAQDARFAELVTDRTGHDLVIEPVELAGLAESVSAPESPAELLRADAATAPFRPRPELGLLREWCDGDPWFGVRLVTGAGGQGKTRLARHLAAGLAGDGWATVILGEHAHAEDLEVLAHVVVPTLVVVDYAEGRTDQLAPLLDALNRTEARVRLLLLARTAGAWRKDRVAPVPQLSVLADDRIVVSLTPVEDAADGRRDAWAEALEALARRLPTLEDYREVSWSSVASELTPPLLADERFRTILAVQMHALATLLQTGDPLPTSGRDEQEVLLEHEGRYWSRVADRFSVTLTPATRRSLVTTATQWGATTADEARKIVAALVTLASTDDVVGNIADWLSTLYHEGGRYWSGLQPDPLGEYLLGAADPETLLVPAVRGAASAGQREHALTILGRAHPQHPHLVEVMAQIVSSGVAEVRAAIAVAPRLANPRPLLAAIDEFIRKVDVPQLTELSTALPRFSLLLGQTAAAASIALTQLLRDSTITDRAAQLPALATSVGDLAVRLSEAGRRADGLAAAEEAVILYQELADADQIYLPDLARSLNNLAVQLSEVGRREEGLTAVEEAVTLRRSLAEDNRDAYLSDLAMSVNNFAVQLSDAGRRAEGLAAAEEATALYRELAEHDRDAYLPHLATAVNNLASQLAQSGRLTAGLTAAEEATTLHRELAENSRDAHLPNLAISVSNLANRLCDVDRWTEGLTSAEEGIALCRELVASNYDAYLPDLANSINNFAVILSATGRHDSALAAAREAIVLRRELVGKNRAAYLPGLAASLNNLAIRLDEVDRADEALEIAKEATLLNRELTEEDRETHLPNLAASLNTLALRLRKADQIEESLGISEEAVTLARELADRNGDSYLPDLAAVLSNFANRLSESGRHEQAAASNQEAIHLYQKLAKIDRDAQLPNLAMVAYNSSLQLHRAGRKAEALAAAKEGAALYRELARIDPGRFGAHAESATELVAHLARVQ